MNNINWADLRVLYPLITGRHICPAATLAQAFPKLMGAKGSQSPVAGGQFITRLARGLGIWSEEEENDLFTPIGEIRPLSLDNLKTMLLAKQVGRDWVLCVGPNRQPWRRPVQSPAHEAGGSGTHAEGDEGEAHEAEDHFDMPPPPPQYGQQYDAPPHPYGPPPGYQFPDATQFDHFTAYNHMMAAMTNLGSGIHHLSSQMQSLTMDYQRSRRQLSASYRGLDQRVSTLSDTVYGMRDDLSQFRQEFYDYRDLQYDHTSAMEEDEAVDDDDENDEDDEADDDSE